MRKLFVNVAVGKKSFGQFQYIITTAHATCALRPGIAAAKFLGRLGYLDNGAFGSIASARDGLNPIEGHFAPDLEMAFDAIKVVLYPCRSSSPSFPT